MIHEADPVKCQKVEVRGMVEAAMVVGEIIPTDVVTHDVDDVGPRVRGWV